MKIIMMIDDNGDDDRVDAVDYDSSDGKYHTQLLYCIDIGTIHFHLSIYLSINLFIYIGKTYLYMDGLLSIMNGTCLWPFINTIVSENPDTAPTSTKYGQRR
jgi:hypothetical protein